MTHSPPYKHYKHIPFLMLHGTAAFPLNEGLKEHPHLHHLKQGFGVCFIRARSPNPDPLLPGKRDWLVVSVRFGTQLQELGGLT